jgi:hypothetical protein
MLMFEFIILYMFQSVDDHLQKDLFVRMLETTITMSCTYIWVLYLIVNTKINIKIYLKCLKLFTFHLFTNRYPMFILILLLNQYGSPLFSPPLRNGRWILLRFAVWCSLFDDQRSSCSSYAKHSVTWTTGPWYQRPNSFHIKIQTLMFFCG